MGVYESGSSRWSLALPWETQQVKEADILLYSSKQRQLMKFVKTSNAKLYLYRDLSSMSLESAKSSKCLWALFDDKLTFHRQNCTSRSLWGILWSLLLDSQLIAAEMHKPKEVVGTQIGFKMWTKTVKTRRFPANLRSPRNGKTEVCRKLNSCNSCKQCLTASFSELLPKSDVDGSLHQNVW